MFWKRVEKCFRSFLFSNTFARTKARGRKIVWTIIFWSMHHTYKYFCSRIKYFYCRKVTFVQTPNDRIASSNYNVFEFCIVYNVYDDCIVHDVYDVCIVYNFYEVYVIDNVYAFASLRFWFTNLFKLGVVWHWCRLWLSCSL